LNCFEVTGKQDLHFGASGPTIPNVALTTLTISYLVREQSLDMHAFLAAFVNYFLKVAKHYAEPSQTCIFLIVSMPA